MKIFTTLLLSFAFSFLYSQVLVVETVGGNGSAGYVDAQGVNAQFSAPQSIDFDSAGNIYVCDNGNNVIRKISPTNVVSTLAGDGVSGHVNGPSGSSRFDSPMGICVLPNNDIYVTEFGHWIRKISGGTVSDLAGNGSPGSSNGTGVAARFNVPSEVSAGLNNNLYILDRFNHKIRSISLGSSVVTDYAGSGLLGFQNGPSNSAEFNRPYDFCVGDNGNIYVADRDNHSIRKVDVFGNVSTIAGNGSPGYVDGPGSSAKFNIPAGIAIDRRGNIYVGDRANHVIRKIDTANVVSTFAGTGSIGFNNGPLATATFSLPTKIAIDTSTSILYISDVGNHSIRKIDLLDDLSIQQNDVAFQVFKAYPNPVRDHINVEYTLKEDQPEVNFKLFDASGKLIKDVTVQKLIIGKNQQYLEIPSLIADGPLNLQMTIGNETYNLKLIKLGH